MAVQDESRPARESRISSRAVILVLGFFLLGYTILRALRVPLTIDEAITFNDYVRHGFWGLFNVDTANNHLLNTLATWLVTRLAGTGVFALRLPNLVSHLVFLVFSYRLLGRYLRGAAAAAGFVIVNANPYVLEFFALSRGYGISLALLTAALYYLCRFGDELRTGEPRALRTLAKTLAAAGAAAAADMALLFVFLAIVVVAFVVLVRHNRTAAPVPDAPPFRRRRHPVVAAGLIALLALINGTNLFRKAYGSKTLFADVSIAVAGLTDQERPQVAVFQKGADGKAEMVPCAADGWRFDQPRFATGILVDVPEALWPGLTAVEIRIGSKLSVFNGTDLRSLATGRDQGRVVLTVPDRVRLSGSKFPPMTGSLNWRGDGPYLVLLGKRVLIVVLLFALLALVLLAAGRLAERLGLVTRPQFRLLGRAIWGLAAVIGVPIYFLRAGGELYWGGKIGFFHDTLLGLVQDVLYGRSYIAGQEYIFVGILAAAAVLFLVAALISRPVRRAGSSGPAVILLGLILGTWGFFMGERPFFGLPYLLGRTAIFLVPLAALLFVFALTSLQALPRLRTAVVCILVAAALASAAHFGFSANTAFASEWMPDAENATLLADLQALRPKIAAPDGTVALAVPWDSAPALTYYLRRLGWSWLKPDIIPLRDGANCQAYYLEEKFDPSRMALLKRYPLSGHILVAPRQP